MNFHINILSARRVFSIWTSLLGFVSSWSIWKLLVVGRVLYWCCELWTCKEPCKCKAGTKGLQVTSLCYKICCNLISSDDDFVKEKRFQIGSENCTPSFLCSLQKRLSGMIEKYIFQSFKEPVTYSKHLRLSFLALLMTSISPPGWRWHGGTLFCWHFYSWYLCLC